MNLFPKGRSEDDPDRQGGGRDGSGDGRPPHPVPPPPGPAPALYPPARDDEDPASYDPASYDRSGGPGEYGATGQGGGYGAPGRSPAYGQQDAAGAHRPQDPAASYGHQDAAASYGRQDPAASHGQGRADGSYGPERTDGPYGSYGSADPAAGQGAPQPAAFYDWQQDQSGWPPGVPSSRSPEAGRRQAPAQGQAAGPGPGHPPAQRQPGRIAATWRPISVDGVLPDFDPRPPTGGLSYRPDTVCDGWSTNAVDLRLASVRGYAHRAEGRPREDDAAAAWDERTGTVVFAVADGVSDARQPHIGSQLACRSAVDELLAQVRANGVVTDWPKLLGTVHWQLLTQARRLLKNPDAGVDETADLLATTLVAGAAVPTADGVLVTLVSVGDSGAWAIKYGELYPLKGGKSVGADGLVSSAVQPMPYVPADVTPFEYPLAPDSVLLLGTDGFGDPVGDGRGAVGRLFGSELERPVPPLAFAQLLDFYRETFDDDRTLVALWPRRGGPGGPR